MFLFCLFYPYNRVEKDATQFDGSPSKLAVFRGDFVVSTAQHEQEINMQHFRMFVGKAQNIKRAHLFPKIPEFYY